jgi:hypothetical protein
MVLQHMGGFTVYLGDGKGNFTADPNPYTPGGALALARLSNQAPAFPNDNAPDLLAFTNGSATSFLNQTNPPPLPLSSSREPPSRSPPPPPTPISN